MEQTLPNWPAAPQWGLFLGIAGKALVFCSIAFFLASALGWILKKPVLGRLGFWMGSISLFGTFACLAALFVGKQFQFEYVFSHSEADLALKYKIAAIWSGQQGSFLLWAVCSAIFGLLVAPFTGIYRRWFTVPYALFLAALSAILAYETPFNLIPELANLPKVLLPPTGTGLTPSLQNYWVVIHPPTIFLGFGSLTVMFCWALAAMIERNPIDWIKMMRPWALVSTTVLGLGLMMGGFWAYETLGWGGFWAWDPVENVSFVPWALMACLIHGMIIQVSRGRYVGANIVLSAVPFLAFAYGTFLTRSGFLGDNSVHSFADMKRGALWVLVGLGAAALVSFLVLYWVRGRRLAREFSAGSAPKGMNREGLYQLGIILLSAIAISTAIGMSAPLFTSELFGRNIAVRKEAYHQILSWGYIPLMFLIGMVPFVSWRKMSGRDFFNRTINVLSISIGLSGICLLAFSRSWWDISDVTKTTEMVGGMEVPTFRWVAFLVSLSIFAIVGNTWRIMETIKKSPMSLGGFISHLGIAVFMAGMILSEGFERRTSVNVQRSSPGVNNGYIVALKENPDLNKIMDRDNKLEFLVTDPAGKTVTMRPGFYYTQGSGEPMAMTWPDIQHFASHDFYFALGGPVMNVTKQPFFLLPGQTQTIRGEPDVKVTYHGYQMLGEPGQPDTKFVGKITVAYAGEEYNVETALSVGGGEPDMPIAGGYRVVMTRIDAANKGAEIQLLYREAVYPVDIFFKPMTSLVWGGAGILFFGGVLSALYRRPRVKNETPARDESELLLDLQPESTEENAPAPVA